MSKGYFFPSVVVNNQYCISIDWAVSPNFLGCGTCYSNFQSGYFLLILFSASQDYNAASSQYSSNTNSCGSCRKQGIRHVKLQGIGLAAYFCTTVIAELWKGEVFCGEREAKAKKGRSKINKAIRFWLGNGVLKIRNSDLWCERWVLLLELLGTKKFLTLLDI